MDIPAEIIQSSSQVQQEQNVQNILLATKAPDAIDALNSILHRLHPTNMLNIVVLSNGVMGVVQDIKHIIKENNVERRTNIIMASTTNGAHRGNKDDFRSLSPDSFCVVHAGLGQTFIEEPVRENELVKTLSTIWRDVGLNANIVSQEEIHVLNWKKLAANCAINPLTAIDGIRNGDLLKTNSSNQQILDNRCLEIIDEVSKVALVETRGLVIGENLEFDNLLQFVETVVRDTAPNVSSMLQDVLAKRYPTEVQYLNGFVARLGERHGINVCSNRKIAEDVEKLTRSFM
jgi:2-dehydropantoate 2-reductase